MRPGAFLATLAAILVLLGLTAGSTVSIAGDFAVPSGGRPRAVEAPRCLALTYDASAGGRRLPADVRLLADTVRGFAGPGRVAFRAVGRPYPLTRHAGWAFAGPDSIDIWWHHSPVLRLPLRGGPHGDTLVGRGGPASYESAFSRPFYLPSFAVRAVERPCSAGE